MPARISEPIAGELRSTPFAHILVYAVDRGLTGALFLEEPSGARHVVSFASGVPVKVRPGDDYALLGKLLIEAGVITEIALTGALSMQGLLGDALILSGCADHEAVESVAAEQFFLRMVHLFELPPETKYTYIEGHAELVEWGGEPSSMDPLALLWAGLREHGNVSVLMDRTLHRLGDTPIRIHSSAVLERFGFTAGELAAILRIKEQPRSLADLTALRAAPPDTLRRLIYTLLITRHLDFGQETFPVGVVLEHPRSLSPTSLSSPTSSVVDAAAPSSALPLGRMQLRTVAVRVGAAAPDLPGEGEPRSSSSSRPRR
jgi:hypothetical protein